MNFELKEVELKECYTGDNVRIDLPQLPELQADITDRGLLTPPTVWKNPEKKNGTSLEIIYGHRRFAVLKNIAKSDKETFKKHFPKGKIPVLVVSGISRQKAQSLKVDSGTSVMLKDPYEAQLCANFMFEDGASDSVVANALSALLSRVSRLGSMSKDTKEKIDNLNLEYEKNRLEDNFSKMEKIAKEIYKIKSEYHRGHVQLLRTKWRCPNIVMACLEFEATKKVPHGYVEEELMRLTNSECDRLYKAFREDLDVLENGIPKYSKLNPGENFKQKYQDIMEAKKNKKSGKKDKSKPVKAMSSKEMQKEVEESIWQSTGFKLLTTHHAGGKITMAKLKDADYMCAIAEIVANNNDKKWQEIVTLAENILKSSNKEKK